MFVIAIFKLMKKTGSEKCIAKRIENSYFVLAALCSLNVLDISQTQIDLLNSSRDIIKFSASHVKFTMITV